MLIEKIKAAIQREVIDDDLVRELNEIIAVMDSSIYIDRRDDLNHSLFLDDEKLKIFVEMDPTGFLQ